MKPTPGQLRQFAAQARHDATEYRRWAHEATDAALKRHYERSADSREEHADYYVELAGRGEITVEYQIIKYQEAAE